MCAPVSCHMWQLNRTVHAPSFTPAHVRGCRWAHAPIADMPHAACLGPRMRGPDSVINSNSKYASGASAQGDYRKNGGTSMSSSEISSAER